MNVRFSIDFSDLLERLEHIASRSEDASREPLASGMRRGMEAYMEAMRKRFRQNSKGKGEWPDLAPSTKLARIRKHGGPLRDRLAKARRGGRVSALLAAASIRLPILVDDGDLWASLQRGGANHVQKLDRDGIEEGTADFKARYHQEGTSRMPRRSILVEPQKQTLDEIQSALSGTMQSIVNGR